MADERAGAGGGHGEGLRALARVMRDRADDIRDDASAIDASAVAVTGPDGWTGRAADAMQASVAEGCAGLERTAGAHDAAADALEACATAVDDSWLPGWVPR